MNINNYLRRIDEINAKINELERAEMKLEDYIEDHFPLRCGDKFKYCGEYCGEMRFLSVNDESDHAFIVLEYRKDNGEYDAIYNVDCDALEKIEAGKEDGNG